MILNPESTYKTWPVIPLAPSEARNDAGQGLIVSNGK